VGQGPDAPQPSAAVSELRQPAPRPSQRRLDGTFRAHARNKVALRALVTHVEKGWQRHVPLEEIGLGGARIVLQEPARPGDIVTVSLTAPSLWDPLVLRARVAWVAPSTPGRAGIAFDHRGGPPALALFELIATLGYE
jgi:hypothetical protein